MMNTMIAMKKTFGSAAQRANNTLQNMMQEYKQELQAQDILSDLAAYLQDDSLILQQRGEQKLLASVKRCTILLDTCAIVNDKFPLLMQHMQPMLREHQKQVLVPGSVLAELKKLGTRDLALREAVRNACELLLTLQRQGVLRILSPEDPNFGDQDIYTLATKRRVETDVLVITHDRALSEDLMKLNAIGSIEGHRVNVCRINQYGFLSGYRTAEGQTVPGGAQRNAQPAPNTRPIPTAGVARQPQQSKPTRTVTVVRREQMPIQGTSIRTVIRGQVSETRAESACRTEICLECGQPFTINEGEQAYYHQHDLALPRRCRPCRQQRRAMRENDLAGELSFQHLMML